MKNDDVKSHVDFGVSIAVSAAVTAYARIYMHKIKAMILELGGKIYYTDTDSIVTNIRLPDHLVGNGAI